MRILLSSAGAKIPLLQALKHAALRVDATACVVAADSSPPVVSQYFADAFWHMPACNDDFVADILTGIQQHHITHILPSRDGELLFWAQLQPRLAHCGVHVLLAPEHAIRLCLDKYSFSLQLAALNLPVIPGLLQPDNSASVWVVKERFGAGSQSLGLALSREQVQAHALKLHQPLFQPYIAGNEISIDAWLDKHSKLKAHIYRYRLKVQHGESQISQTVELPQYDEIVRHLLESLGLTGAVVVQAIIDQQQQLHIIECNSRFGGASTLGIKAGVDSLYWSLAETTGVNVATLPFHSTKQAITQVRYANDLYL